MYINWSIYRAAQHLESYIRLKSMWGLPLAWPAWAVASGSSGTQAGGTVRLIATEYRTQGAEPPCTLVTNICIVKEFQPNSSIGFLLRGSPCTDKRDLISTNIKVYHLVLSWFKQQAHHPFPSSLLLSCVPRLSINPSASASVLACTASAAPRGNLLPSNSSPTATVAPHSTL